MIKLSNAQRKELSDFNFEKMRPAPITNLVKVCDTVGFLDCEGWHDFITEGTLNLNLIATEAGVSRSSLYQNPHIMSYISSKAETLQAQGLLRKLPYQKNEPKTGSGSQSSGKYSATEDEIREKNELIKSLQTQVAELSARVDGLKKELRDTQARLDMTDNMERHLLKFGRCPR